MFIWSMIFIGVAAILWTIRWMVGTVPEHRKGTSARQLAWCQGGLTVMWLVAAMINVAGVVMLLYCE